MHTSYNSIMSRRIVIYTKLQLQECIHLPSLGMCCHSLIMTSYIRNKTTTSNADDEKQEQELCS